MADTPNRGYLIPDPEESVFPQLRDMILDVDADVEGVVDAIADDRATDRTRFRAASDLPVVFHERINVATAADPSTLGDLLNWYKADSLTLDHGDSVASWTNSGSGSAATPPGTAPTFVANAVNGKSAVRFTGGAYLSFTERTNVRTVYAVVRYNYENLSNPIPSLGIGHGTTADWVGNQGTRVFAPSGSVGANISGGSGYYNGTQYSVELLSKSPDFAVYSFVTSGNTSVSRLGSDREAWFFEGDIAEIILCSTAHDTATRQSIEAHLINKYARQMPAVLIGDGDSISSDQPLFGDGVGDAQSAWVIQTVANLEPALGSIDAINCALGGQKWIDLVNDVSTEVVPLIGSDRLRYVVAAMCGTNDLLQSTSLADMQTRAETYYSALKAAGALVIVITIPSCDTNESTRLSFNQWLRDNYTTFADELADAGGDTRLVDVTDTAYFSTDEIHLTSAGLAVIAEYVGPAVLSVLGVSAPPEIEFLDPNSYEPSIWLRTSSFMGFVDNDPVASPPNSAASGTVSLTQSTGANRALYKTNLLNSKPGLRFDGSNDSYVIDSAEYRTIFIVAKYAPGTTFADFNGLIDLSGNRHLLNGVQSTSKVAAGTGSFLAAYKNGAELAFSSGYDFAPINTYWIGSFILPTKQVGAGTLGIVTGTGNRTWNGDVLEVIVYPQKLSDAQRRNVEGYLGYEYGIDTGSSYVPTGRDGRVRLSAGPTGVQILVDGNQVIGIDPDGLVDVERDLIWTGAAWDSYTPTWSNLTVGDGTVTAWFKQLGKTVVCRLTVVLGSTSAISGGVSFSLPVTRAAYAGTAGLMALGSARFFDTSAVAANEGVVLSLTTTQGHIQVYDASANYLKTAGLTNLVPFTWATGDEIQIQFIYEAA